jgi:hypothetical protein
MASRSTENPTHEVTAELEVSHPDGTTERRRITVKDRGQPMTADLARELSSFTSIPVGELLS